MKKQTFTLLLIILFFTVQGIAQWSPLEDNVVKDSYRIWSLKVAPDESVWAIATYDGDLSGQFPQVIRSMDEGQTWSSVDIEAGISTNAWDICPIDANTAYITLDELGLYKTTDGGNTWTALTTGVGTAHAVHFFNENDGVLIGQEGVAIQIALTEDGGQTWMLMGGIDWVEPVGTSLPTYSSGDYILSGYSMASLVDNADNVLAFSVGRNYWITADKGLNWERKITPFSTQSRLITALAVKDENTVMVGGDLSVALNFVLPRTYTTQDGAETWKIGLPMMTVGGMDYIPESDSVFIVTGHSPFTLGDDGTTISYDYGQSWTKIHDVSILAVDFLDQNTAYGGCCNNPWQTANGQIHKWDFDLSTSTSQRVEVSDIKLVPNPVTSTLFIDVSNEFDSEKLSIEIVAFNGQVVNQYEMHNNGEVIVNVDHLPKGLYSIRITGEYYSGTSKFIKQ